MKKKAVVVWGMCLAGMLLQNPLLAEAKEANSVRSIGNNIGAASIYTLDFTEEECLLAAENLLFSEYETLGIAEVSGNLNVRKSPFVSAELVGKMKNGSACEILDITDGWAHIVSGKVEGYVSAEYLLTGAEARQKAREQITTVAKVTAQALKVRDDADFEAAVLTLVPKEEELDYVETVGEWIKVNLDGNEAYVHGQYVEIIEKLDTAVTMEELQYGEGISSIRADIAEYAMQFIGNPYVWGGTSLTKGADCSGFVQSVFKNFDIRLSRTSREQAKDGKEISFSLLQPGDLIFYANSSGTINHVAIYIGNSQVVHASSPKTGIKISDYNYRTPVKYVNVIGD